MKSERDFPALVAPGPALREEQAARAARQLTCPDLMTPRSADWLPPGCWSSAPED